jgi:hypothetical protein
MRRSSIRLRPSVRNVASRKATECERFASAFVVGVPGIEPSSGSGARWLPTRFDRLIETATIRVRAMYKTSTRVVALTSAEFEDLRTVVGLHGTSDWSRIGRLMDRPCTTVRTPWEIKIRPTTKITNHRQLVFRRDRKALRCVRQTRKGRPIDPLGHHCQRGRDQKFFRVCESCVRTRSLVRLLCKSKASLASSYHPRERGDLDRSRNETLAMLNM